MSEAELVKRLKHGDREAFNVLVKEYEGKIINIAYGMLSDKEEALDASQEVFIRIYKSIDSFKGNSSLSTWIYTIAVNICRDCLRKRQRSAKTVSIDTSLNEDMEVMEIADTSLTPEQKIEQTERQKLVRQAIDELSEEYKTVITLCDIEGMAYDKIAEILKCPTGTVKSRLNRARAALRNKISEKRELFF